MPKSLILPWPPRELSPNSRAHWGRKSKAAKTYRTQCHLLCKQAGLVAPTSGKILLSLVFVPADRRRRDDDNCLGAFKAGRDGLADALGIDDSRFITRLEISEEVVKGGQVRVRLLSEEIHGE